MEVHKHHDDPIADATDDIDETDGMLREDMRNGERKANGRTSRSM